MLFAPAHTTRTGVRDSSARSAETSNGSSPRCAPPMPPVANTRTPAASASAIVADTVVAASRFSPTAAPRSRRLALNTPCARANSSTCSAVSPTVGVPCHTATVAGTAPPARTAASASRAVSRFAGHGSPCAISVDSSATTGRPSRRAVATSAPTASHDGIMRLPSPRLKRRPPDRQSAGPVS